MPCSAVLVLRPLAAFLPATTVLLLGLGAQAPRPHPQALLDQLPARIEPNRGQWDSPELYRVHAGGLPVFLEQDGWSFWLRQGGAEIDPATAGSRRPAGADPREAVPMRALAVRMTFVGAAAPTLVPEQRLGGSSNHFVGGDGSRDRSAVPGFTAVLYRGVHQGVDVRVRTDGGVFEYDLLLAPGAELAQVQIQVDGAERLALADDGSLRIVTALGEVQQPLPKSWIVGSDGQKRAIDCRYELRGPSSFGFRAPDRRVDQSLVVDPPLLYSTMFGGTSQEEVYTIVEDAAGRILVGGNTQSLGFPTTTGVIQTMFGGGTTDGYLVLLDPSQPPASQMVFATHFGGNGNERIASVAWLPGGFIAFAGDSTSLDLSARTTTGAFQPTNQGGRDGYVGVMTGDGSTIVALTHLGGSADDWLLGLAVTPGGHLLVTGCTQSTNHPVTANAYQPTHRGGPNGFDGTVAIVDAMCTSVFYATYVGGTGDEWIECSGVDASGVVTLHGATSSLDFPVTATAFQRVAAGGSRNSAMWNSEEGIVLQLDPTLPPGQQLRYSTYLGGANQEWCDQTVALPSGRIVVVGTTSSPSFPTTPGSYRPTFIGGAQSTVNLVAGDAFVAVLDPTQAGSAGMVWGTFFGTTAPDQGLDCVVDSGGEVTLVGWTQSNGSIFPATPGAFRSNYALNEGFVAQLSADGRQLLYASLLGGSNHDGAWLVTRHADSQPTVTGATVSSDFPVVNATATYSGAYDTFVTRMALLPANLTRYGAPTGHQGRYPTIHALGDAVPGNAGFGFGCSRAPAFRAGVLMVAMQPAAMPFYGITAHVDLNGLVGTLVVFADSRGEHRWPLRLPMQPMTGFHVQYLWLENDPPLILSASDAMRF